MVGDQLSDVQEISRRLIAEDAETEVWDCLKKVIKTNIVQTSLGKIE
jgi:hypothetical protein